MRTPPNLKLNGPVELVFPDLFVDKNLSRAYCENMKQEKRAAIRIVDKVIGVKKRKRNAAFTRPMRPDAALGAVVGTKPIPRAQVTKKVWAYVKRKGLQDKKKKTMINVDDNLRVVFGGKKQVTMFEMTKLVNRHLK